MTTPDLPQLRFAARLCTVLLLLSLPRTRAAAQALCDDDAGLAMCDDDAGVSMPLPDAGSDAGAPVGPIAGGGGARADAGMSRADAGPGATACSCEAALDEDGRIHVCTESGQANVCASFDCEIGTRRNNPCPQRPTRLCCEMPARGLQSYLYEDCSHPNCESGFREQCRAFAGRVYAGACEHPANGHDDGPRDDDSDGFCSVSAPGRRNTAPLIGLALTLAATALTARRRRIR